MDISEGKVLKPPFKATDLYSPGYSAGARVHSNSWGSDKVGNGFYSAGNADTDRYLYENKELIIIFAVGKRNQMSTCIGSFQFKIFNFLHCYTAFRIYRC
jgi:hypothetical protein